MSKLTASADTASSGNQSLDLWQDEVLIYFPDAFGFDAPL